MADEAGVQPGEQRASPFGAVGLVTAACACGRGPHATRAGMCAGGHPLVGTSGPAVVTSEHEVAFWQGVEPAQRAIEAALISDAGFRLDDAPEALKMATESAAQAKLIRDTAFRRVAAAGGPMTASERQRRCFTVWASAVDRLERHLRLLGLRRVPRPAMSLSEYLASAADVDELDQRPPTTEQPAEAGE